MKNLSISLFAAIAVLLTPMVAQAQQLKIGVINAGRLLEQAPMAKRELDRLKKEFSGRERRLEAQRQSLDGLENKMRRDGPTMSEDTRVRKAREFDDQRLRLASDARNYKEDFARARQKALVKLQENMNEVIRSVALSNGYDLILSDGVVFASDKVDITDEVLRRLGR